MTGIPVPITPYHGTSGHSGSDASADRAAHRDGSGLTAETQQRLYRVIAMRGEYGLTVAEARSLLTADHHGTISGALSNLHMKGFIARLADKRDRCQIYVLPEQVDGRETKPHGRKRSGVTDADRELIHRAHRAHASGVDPVPVTRSSLGRLLKIIEKLS